MGKTILQQQLTEQELAAKIMVVLNLLALVLLNIGAYILLGFGGLFIACGIWTMHLVLINVLTRL